LAPCGDEQRGRCEDIKFQRVIVGFSDFIGWKTDFNVRA
jgi:hypothetical protein